MHDSEHDERHKGLLLILKLLAHAFDNPMSGGTLAKMISCPWMRHMELDDTDAQFMWLRAIVRRSRDLIGIRKFEDNADKMMHSAIAHTNYAQRTYIHAQACMAALAS